MQPADDSVDAIRIDVTIIPAAPDDLSEKMGCDVKVPVSMQGGHLQRRPFVTSIGDQHVGIESSPQQPAVDIFAHDCQLKLHLFTTLAAVANTEASGPQRVRLVYRCSHEPEADRKRRW